MKVYISLKQSIATDKEFIKIRDIAEISCYDKSLSEIIQNISIWHFDNSEPDRKIISIIDVVNCIYSYFRKNNDEEPDIFCMGEENIVIEHGGIKNEKKIDIAKVILVSVIVFFGSAFAIMSFHEDIGIEDLFVRICEMLGLTKEKDIKIFGVAYSIGLSIGILIFYKQLRKSNIKEPSPLDMEMMDYEEKYDSTIISEEERMEK